MILPLFIAILLGLVSPSESTSSNCHNSTTVSVNSTNGDDQGGEGDDGGDGIDHGGETGQIPPPKKND